METKITGGRNQGNMRNSHVRKPNKVNTPTTIADVTCHWNNGSNNGHETFKATGYGDGLGTSGLAK
jgi:hypothetical protein